LGSYFLSAKTSDIRGLDLKEINREPRGHREQKKIYFFSKHTSAVRVQPVILCETKFSQERNMTEEKEPRTSQTARTKEDRDNNYILYKKESFLICSCIFEVNRKLGIGFLESVYQEAMEIELEKSKIPFIPKQKIQIAYDGQLLEQTYEADIVCYGKIILELKAVQKIREEHKAQLINYLSATGMKLGILVNFHSHPKAEITRFVNTH
jgi:GxxExxY protein